MNFRMASALELGRDESWSVASSFVDDVWDVNVQSAGRTRFRISGVM